MARGHAERLVPVIQAALAEADVSLRRIELLAVTTGPGSFTGIRIGLATAEGLALANGLPTIGLTTLEILAAGVPDGVGPGPRLILAAIDSKRGDAFAQLFAQSGAADPIPLAGPCGVSPSSLWSELVAPAIAQSDAPVSEIVLVGNLDADTAQIIRGSSAPGPAVIVRQQEPDAAVLARLASQRGPDAGSVPPPLYLRPPDVRPPPGTVAGTRATDVGEAR